MSTRGPIVLLLPRGLADERNRKRLNPSSLPVIHKIFFNSNAFSKIRFIS